MDVLSGGKPECVLNLEPQSWLVLFTLYITGTHCSGELWDSKPKVTTCRVKISCHYRQSNPGGPLFSLNYAGVLIISINDKY
jgi:hypothetical protein